MEPKKNRTIICSVVFLDIVGYSLLPVARQHRVKDRFNALVAAQIERIPTDERIILDTGDGAALCFIGDPEDALFVAMDLRNDIAAEPEIEGEPYPAVRIGINLGPVRAVQDLNGRMNLIGDGINVGQRIMSFCDPEQILVSRSYFEVVGCLSNKHAALFKYHGARQDKHVREHVIYEVHLEAADESTRIGFSEPEAGASDSPSASIRAPYTMEVVDHASESATEPTTGSDVVTLESAWLDSVQHDLAVQIGPLATVLVRRAKTSARNVDDFLRILASALPEHDRPAFIARSAPGDGPADESGSPSSGARSDAAELGGKVRAWTDDERARIEQALAKQVGPMAKILVERAVTRCSSLAELCSSLAGELDRAEQRNAFLAAMDGSLD